MITLFLSDDTVSKFRSGKGSGKTFVSKKDTGAFEADPEIVFEDDNIIAVNKPAGMLSQKVKNSDWSVNDFLLSHVTSDDLFKPGISNRLDRNTSGLIAAGKNPASARELNEAIRERSISKKYLCLAAETLTEEVRLEGYLVKDEKSNLVSVSDFPAEGTDHVITGYIPLETGKTPEGHPLTLLEVELITGKSHQIRAHLAFTGHPIIGDPKYGDRELNSYFYSEFDLKRQLLHAFRLEFSGMRGILEYLNGTRISADLPEDFKRICLACGIKI